MKKTEADWRAALAPWLAPLQNKPFVNEPILPTRDELDELWIDLPVPSEDDVASGRWKRVCEAVELLDLLVCVDADVGWRVVLSLLRPLGGSAVCEHAWFCRDQRRRRPRYRLDSLDSELIQENVEDLFVALDRMIGGEPAPEPPSRGFVEVKTQLLDAWRQQHHGLGFDRGREGYIEIGLVVTLSTNALEPNVTLLMDELLELARANRVVLPLHRQREQLAWRGNGSEAASTTEEHEARRNARRKRAVFCFASLDFVSYAHPMTEQVMYNLFETHREGIPVESLMLDQLLMTQIPWSVSCVFLIQLLGVWRGLGKGLKRFEWLGGRFDRQTVSAIGSALAVGQSITEFEFTQPDYWFEGMHEASPSRSIWWPWLAFALFSNHATNIIEHVSLRVQTLSMDDVRAIEEVLQHPNPLSYVCSLVMPEPHRQVLTSTPTAAFLKPETRVNIGHHGAEFGEETVINEHEMIRSTDVPHDIVRDVPGEDFVEIVVVACGICWVNRSDVLETVEVSRRVSQTVKRLDIDDIAPESSPAVLELLGLIGDGLEELTLATIAEPLSDSFVETALSFCPRVKTLRFQNDLESVNWLLTPSASHRGFQHLEFVCDIVDQLSLIALLTALSQEDHPLSRSLRALYIHERNPRRRVRPNAESLVAEIAEQWLTMLHKNRRLEKCQFSRYPESEGGASFQERLRELNGQPILVPERLAFLSVLTDIDRQPGETKRRKTSTDHHPRYQLARETAELILAIAGIPSTRICV